MTKIYTKTGDKGKTGLVDGSRVSKSDARIRVLGVFDEANAALGFVAAAVPEGHASRALLLRAQSLLFNCGARIAEPLEESVLGIALPDKAVLKEYEYSIDAMTAQLSPLKRFILPGGTELSARAHMARGVVRRSERELVALKDGGVQVDAEILQFVNRLSDWLFTLARYYNFEAGQKDIPWRP